MFFIHTSSASSKRIQKMSRILFSKTKFVHWFSHSHSILIFFAQREIFLFNGGENMSSEDEDASTLV